MSEYIAFDSHKHYTLMEREAVESGRVAQRRIEHAAGAIREALAGCQPGTTVAVEAMGSWYWIVQEIEQAGLVPALVHPRKAKLPDQTRWCSELLWDQLELVNRQIGQQEERLEELMEITPQIGLIKTLPGIGLILAGVIAMEIGDLGRFARAERLASYAGTTPRVHSSGDKTRYGRLRPDVNRYLKWAFIEAGNCVALHASGKPERHVSRLYQRLRYKRGHSKAVGAVARHLAEATYWVLKLNQPYRDPSLGRAQEGVSADAACLSGGE